MNEIRSAWLVVAVACTGLLSAACQSAKIADFQQNHELGTSNAVTVEPFDMSRTKWTGDQGGHTPAEVQTVLSSAFMHWLNEKGLENRPVAAADGILVRGSVDLVEAGSGAARVLIGFGAGQSKFVCTAQLFNLAVSRDVPAYVLHVEGGTHGKGGFQAAGYPCAADAGDAAEQIVTFIVAHRTGAAAKP